MTPEVKNPQYNHLICIMADSTSSSSQFEITFKVDDVEPEIFKAPTSTTFSVSYQTLFEQMFANENEFNQKVTLESVADTNGQNVIPCGSNANAFLAICSKAYAEHIPLELTSDQFKLTVCQALSNHINANPEAFREVLVSHSGKKTVVVRRDDFVKGKLNPWTEVFTQFTDCLKADTKDTKLIEHITANSTTTTVATRAALDISLMDTFKSFYDYLLRTMCGIPSITLKGTLEDWVNLREFVRYIEKFDFKWYTDEMTKILDEIIQTVQGNCNVSFWQNMVKYKNTSGGPYYSGWIKYLFPYLLVNSKPTRSLRYSSGDKYKITSDDVPSGMTYVPFEWDYLGKKFPMRFCAGFVGAVWTAEGKLTPGVSWAVAAIENLVDPKLVEIYQQGQYLVSDGTDYWTKCSMCEQNKLTACVAHAKSYLCIKCVSEIDTKLKRDREY